VDRPCCPPLNAVLNATSAVFLVLGRARHPAARRTSPSNARAGCSAPMGASSRASFLVSYIVYHSVHGDFALRRSWA